MAQEVSYDFCEIFKNTFLAEHIWATASKGWSSDPATRNAAAAPTLKNNKPKQN